jgi:tyrosine-protein kinase Etk/Wzc
MSEEQFFNDKPQTNILAQIVHRYLPFWPIFVGLSAIALLIAYIDLRSQTKIYVAGSTVLLKDPQKSPDSKVLEAMNIFDDKKTVENEVIVLKSASLVNQVVKDLDLYNTVYNQGKVITEELYKDNAPVSFIAVDKNNIESHGKFSFAMNWEKKNVEIDGRSIPFNSILSLQSSGKRKRFFCCV